MSVLPVKDNKVQLTEDVGTVYQNGVLMAGEKATFATASPVTYSNGIQRTATGAIFCVDATAGLPAGYTWCNGLPFSILGALCISSNAVASWSNGIPFDANGAVAAYFLPTPTMSLDFTTGTLDSRVTFTRASGGTRVNSSGVIELMTTNTPRFDYDPVTLAAKGLLIEEQRTNTIRNNTMVGAVAGTPGTMPTNWGFFGVTPEVVSVGVENGISYVDLRISGAPTNGINVGTSFGSNTEASASASQAWTQSGYIKLISGTLPVPALKFALIEFDSASGFLRATSSSAITPTTAPLSSQRTSFSITTGASTAFIRPDLLFTANGSAFDFTLRIGLPQLEQGAFATSPIPTTTAQATRAADVAVMTGTNFSTWYNQSEGTLYAEATSPMPATLGGNRAIVSLSDGTYANYITLYKAATAALVGGEIVRSSAVQAAITRPYAVNTSFKMAISYVVNNVNFAADGVLGTPDTTATMPSALNKLSLLDATGAGSGHPTMHIKAVKYWNTRLINAELQAATA